MPNKPTYMPITLASAQLLTASYVTTSTVGAIDVRGVSQVTVYREYAPGTGETSNTLEIRVQTSVDGTPTNFHIEGSLTTTTPSAVTDNEFQYQSASTSAGTTYLGVPIRIPIDANHLRIQVKETGVATNFGTCTIRVVLRYI